jgi:hypothetical protein
MSLNLRFSLFNIIILSVLVLLSGCITSSRTSIASQWPLQAGSDEIYQHYEEESLPLEEVAILDVRNPLGVMRQISPMSLTAKQDYYYSGEFSLKPGKQVIALSYLRNSGASYYSSLKPIEVTLNAEKGRLYQTFYLEDYELYMETKDPKDLHRIYVEIYDVTDREALSKMANSARFKAFRREARAILQQLDAQIGTDAPAK